MTNDEPWPWRVLHPYTQFDGRCQDSLDSRRLHFIALSESYLKSPAMVQKGRYLLHYFACSEANNAVKVISEKYKGSGVDDT